MAFTKFKEYLNDKGDVQKKADVDGRADTGPSGKDSPKPPKAQTKGKNWKNFQVKDEAAQVEDGGNGTKPAPYSAPGTDPGLQHAADEKGEKSPVKGLYSDTLAGKGSKDLIYKPKTADQALKMKKLHDTTPEDNKTEQFLSQTSGLSTGDYADFILKRNDAKSIKHVLELAEILNQNSGLLETFLRELKRKGSFDKLVEAVLDHPETYATLAHNLADQSSRGKAIARQVAKAVSEITAEPAADDIVPEKPASRNMPANDDIINARGQAVTPDMNARRAKSVKGVPTETDNIMQSRKLRPEHQLIEALANYKSIKSTMKKLVD